MTDREPTALATLSLQRAKRRYAPDDRVAVADVTPTLDGDAVVLRGTVSDDRIRRGLRGTVDRALPDRDVRTDVVVLESSGTPKTTGDRMVPVKGSPDADAEQVTQALYGSALVAYDARGEWRRVRTPDTYLGWVEQGALVDREDDWTQNAVLTTATSPSGDLAVSGDGATLPAGTPCRVASGLDRSGGGLSGGDPSAEGAADLDVSFRTGERATLSRDAVRRTRPIAPGEVVVDVATAFLDRPTPYEWGGMTETGIDCSGLVWVAYAAAGVRLPRDADQQREMGRPVDRDSLEPGDLLFFPGHVAISLGGAEYVHAYGTPGEVTINSLDSADDRYVESLDESMTDTKRLLPEVER